MVTRSWPFDRSACCLYGRPARRVLAIHLGRHYHDGPARLGRDAAEATRPSMSMPWLHDVDHTLELYIFTKKCFVFYLITRKQ